MKKNNLREASTQPKFQDLKENMEWYRHEMESGVGPSISHKFDDNNSSSLMSDYFGWTT